MTYYDPNQMAQELYRKARECCALIERLERTGNTVDFRIEWTPGLTAMFQTTRCWEPDLSVNGIEVSP